MKRKANIIVMPSRLESCTESSTINSFIHPLFLRSLPADAEQGVCPSILHQASYKSEELAMHARFCLAAAAAALPAKLRGRILIGFICRWLAREGKRVRLFDANDVSNVESQTLITTSTVTEVLEFYPQEAVVNEIDQIDLHSPGRSVTIPMKEPDLVVERSAVVRLLARKARDAGVEIRAGCKLLGFKPGDQGSTITIRDTHQHTLKKFKTKNLIGADGTSKRVAKSAIGNGHATTPLLQAVVELPNGWRAGTTQVWFEPEIRRISIG